MKKVYEIYKQKITPIFSEKNDNCLECMESEGRESRWEGFEQETKSVPLYLHERNMHD